MNNTDTEPFSKNKLLRIKRQVFIPSNQNTNTFVFDTVSFLGILTLVVFIVRVFNRVMKSNNLQQISLGADPSLGRAFSDGQLGQLGLESDESDLEQHKLSDSDLISDPRFNESSRNKFINNSSLPIINFSIRFATFCE